MRIFVTGTDTGVGKTEAASALLSLMADAGLEPAPFKPYESGMRRLSEPADALALLAAARSEDRLEDVSIHRFRAPLAPGVAAKRAGVEPDFQRTMAAFQRFRGRAMVVEGAGGLFVPIDSKRDVIDLVAALRLEVLLVARSGLGTLNHTALSLEALARRRIKVRAVVLVRTVASRDPSERDNARVLAGRHNVPILGPVGFEEDAKRRRAAFRRALRPLMDAKG